MRNPFKKKRYGYKNRKTKKFYPYGASSPVHRCYDCGQPTYRNRRYCGKCASLRVRG